MGKASNRTGGCGEEMGCYGIRIGTLHARVETWYQPFTSQIRQHVELCFSTFRGNSRLFVESNGKEVCRVLYSFAWQLYRSSSSDDATYLVSQLLQERSKIPGGDRTGVDLLRIRYLLGICLQREHKDEEGRRILLEVVQEQEAILNSDDPDLLASQHALAGSYRADGQIAKAVEMLEHVVEVNKALPKNHPSCLSSQHELAVAYHANGQIAKAVEILEHVMEMKKALPENHPNRLASQHELARAYRTNGQIAKAVEILEHVVKVRKALPENHPDRLVSQHVLAVPYHANGQIAEAVEMLEPVVEVRRALPENHPSRLASQRALVEAYLRCRSDDKAAELTMIMNS